MRYQIDRHWQRKYFPSVIPSINLAKNNITKGRVRTKVPRSGELTLKIFSLGKNNATKNIQPIKVPALKEVFFPAVSIRPLS